MNKNKAERALEYLDEGLILSAMDESDMNGKRMKKRKNKTVLKTIGGIVAAFAIFFFGCLTGLIPGGIVGGIIGFIVPDIGISNGMGTVKTSAATIAFDVNPSFEIEINEDEEIMEVRAINADAEKVIGTMELKGVDLEVAVNALIGSLLKNGYISANQNSILVSIDSSDEKRSEELQARLYSEISALLGSVDIEAAVITQNYDKDETNSIANENNISKAKATLISKIVDAKLHNAEGELFSPEALARLNVNELKIILENNGIKVDGANLWGSTGAAKYISLEKALDIALSDAELILADIGQRETSMSYSSQYETMLYKIKLYVSDQGYDYGYEYIIDAANGNILKKDVQVPEYTTASPDTIDMISYDDALRIACDNALLDISDIKNQTVTLNAYDPNYSVGRLYYVYFESYGLRYNYIIDAVTCGVIECSVESILEDTSETEFYEETVE